MPCRLHQPPHKNPQAPATQSWSLTTLHDVTVLRRAHQHGGYFSLTPRKKLGHDHHQHQWPLYQHQSCKPYHHNLGVSTHQKIPKEHGTRSLISHGLIASIALHCSNNSNSVAGVTLPFTSRHCAGHQWASYCWHTLPQGTNALHVAVTCSRISIAVLCKYAASICTVQTVIIHAALCPRLADSIHNKFNLPR